MQKAQIKTKNNMKTFFSSLKNVLAAIFLLVVMYFVIVDGMMTHFDLSRGIQYAYNFSAIFVLMPLGLYFLLDMDVDTKA